MRLSANFHGGVLLGIVTTGVILALGGCAASSSVAVGDSAPPAASKDAAFADFSDSERERILAVQDIVNEAARTHDLDPTLINAMIWVESRFDPRAKSSAGARGLMQLMPATAAYLAKRMGEHNARAYDPEFNVNAGSLYLAQMLETFGDERLAVAAYHAGPGNVKRWVETGETFPDYSQAYVAKVMDAQARFAGAELHGRSSASRRNGAAGVVDADELEVPDVESLPDAADIHGVPRVIYEQPQAVTKPEPEQKREPTPVVVETKPVEHPPVEHQPVASEPVFVVHPELDANPDAAPSGWGTPSRDVEAEPRPQPKPKPKPKPQLEPEPKPEPKPKTGLGVLPDL